MRKVVVAIGIGMVVTLVLFALGFFAIRAGNPTLGMTLFWHYKLMTVLFPEYDAAHNPILWISVFLGFIIYGTLAYVALDFLRRAK
jgi:hypothetical protein